MDKNEVKFSLFPYKENVQFDQDIAHISLKVKDNYHTKYPELKEGDQRDEYFRINRSLGDALRDSINTFSASITTDYHVQKHFKNDEHLNEYKTHVKKQLAAILAEQIIESGKFNLSENFDYIGNLNSSLIVNLFYVEDEKAKYRNSANPRGRTK